MFIERVPTYAVSTIMECASDDCAGPAEYRMEASGVGSYYCDSCIRKIQELKRKETSIDGDN